MKIMWFAAERPPKVTDTISERTPVPRDLHPMIVTGRTGFILDKKKLPALAPVNHFQTSTCKIMESPHTIQAER